jgi:hypothetical protein
MKSELWSLLVVIGFWGWVLCTVGLILRSFPRQQQIIAARAARWGAGVVLFFFIWISGMLNA